MTSGVQFKCLLSIKLQSTCSFRVFIRSRQWPALPPGAEDSAEMKPWSQADASMQPFPASPSTAVLQVTEASNTLQ